MDNDFPDWNLDKVKLEPEVILDDNVATDENFSESSMDNKQQERAALEGTSVFPEELIKVKIEADLAEENDLEENRRHLDFTQSDPEIGVEEPLMGGRQHFLPETDLPPAHKTSSMFPVERVYIKEEVNSREESDDAKDNRQVALRKACIKRMKGICYGRKRFIAYSQVKKPQSAFEKRALSANVAQKTGNKAENFDRLADESAFLHSEHFPQITKITLDSENGSVVDSPSVPSMRAVENNTGKNVAPDQTKSMLHSQPFTSKQCSATSEFKPVDVTSTNKKRFSCHLCPAKFNRKFYFKTHMKAHAEGKTISCNQCCAQFKHRQSLRRHLLTHTDERAFSCDQCPAQFRQKSHLQNHLLTHASEKAFSCDECSARFKLKCNLQKHLLTHSDERAFSCDKCSAAFKLKCNLQEHLLTHFSERAFSCNLCSARFKQKRGLKMHLINHTDNRAFSCDQCSTRFKRKYDLQRHFLTHSDMKLFTCDQCSAGFKRKSDLNRHLLTHSDTRTLSCD